jgi:hypothetical protein
MEKEFVTYELALRMKQLGFDETCCGYYDHIIKELDIISSEVCERLCKHDTHIKAPTFSQAFRWFRDNHGLKSWVQQQEIDTFIYEIRPHVLSDYKEGEIYVYDTHEETETVCLEKLIEIVEQKNNLDQNP